MHAKEKYHLYIICHESRIWKRFETTPTLQALEMWLFATMTHSMPCSTSTGMARSVNTISAGKKPAPKTVMCLVLLKLIHYNIIVPFEYEALFQV